MKKGAVFVIVLAVMLAGRISCASELVYNPVSPSFGGSPLNSSFILSQADSQNTFKDKSLSVGRDPMDSFEESLVRRVLNNLANNIIDSAFDTTDSEMTDGFYQFGDYTIEVDTSLTDNVNVTITDISTGNATTIEIPQYTF